MNKLGMAVIGAGAIAQRNAREAARTGLVKIAGVYDPNNKVAVQLARGMSTAAYAGFEQALGHREVEAVLISTPHYLHRDQAVRAAECGKHVLVEKPLANTLAEARDMIAACAGNGVSLTVNYSFRYLPKIRKARELVHSGVLGDITGIQILSHQFKDPGYWLGARSNSPDDWRASKARSGGGLLIMSTCHPIDYIYYITGLKATRVYSEYGTLNSSAEVEDIIGVTCRFNNGAVGIVNASSIMRGFEQGEERIWGTRGTMVISADGLSVYSTRPVENRKPGRIHTWKKFPESSWTADWISGFVRAVREGRPPDIGARDGWENLAFITSSYESLQEKRPVDVPAYGTARQEIFCLGKTCPQSG